MDGFLSQEQQSMMAMQNQQMFEQQQLYEQQLAQQAMFNQNMMMQQPMYDQSMMMQQGFNQNMNIGIPKLTKGQVIDNLSTYVFNQTGVLVSKVEKIEEMPQTLRHSCVATGVVTLGQFIFTYPSPQGYINLPFFFCNKCGKLYYCPDYLL